MQADQLDQLPPAMRLALAYAPKGSHTAIASVFLLDSRLARIGAQASEPIIAQMKLAWWRDQFAKPVTEWPTGEPLLESIAKQGLPPARLAGLVDGWEALIASDALSVEVIEAYVAGRGASWLGVVDAVEAKADAEEVLRCARIWALADLASHLEGEGRKQVRELLKGSENRLPKLPRQLRPFQVLAALGQRSARRYSMLLDGLGALTLAIRVGIFGR